MHDEKMTKSDGNNDDLVDAIKEQDIKKPDGEMSPEEKAAFDNLKSKMGGAKVHTLNNQKGAEITGDEEVPMSEDELKAKKELEDAHAQRQKEAKEAMEKIQKEFDDKSQKDKMSVLFGMGLNQIRNQEQLGKGLNQMMETINHQANVINYMIQQLNERGIRPLKK